MTNKEAIDILRNAAWLGTDADRKQIEEAVEMAINALKKEAWKEEHPASPLLQKLATNLQPSKQDDLIERARAIEIIHELQDSQTVDQNADNAYDLVEWAISEIPSAQPELIRINLNEPIKVKLTDWGKEIYYHQYDRTNQIAGREICKPMFPREDENGYTEFQLWCFIELYGMHMGMTLPNVIEPLEIVYER